jgi:hypothetical protein
MNVASLQMTACSSLPPTPRCGGGINVHQASVFIFNQYCILEARTSKKKLQKDPAYAIQSSILLEYILMVKSASFLALI